MGFFQTVLYKEYRLDEPIPWLLWPFKNRYSRLAIYAFTLILTTIVYYGWQPLSTMLFRSNAYAWLCPVDWDFEADGPCDDQDAAVQSLYIIGLSCEFSFSVVAGVLYDYAGPRLAALVGECVFVLGWIMLIYSSESAPMYIPAFILMGGAVNFNAFPCTVASDMFRSRPGLIISMIIAAQTGATLVAPVMNAVWVANPQLSFDGLVWTYLIVVLPTVVIFIFSLPTSRRAVAEAMKPKDNDEIVKDVDMELSAMPEPLKPVTVGKSLSSSSSEMEPLKKAVSIAIPKEKSAIPRRSLKEKFYRIGVDVMTVEFALFATYYFFQILQYGYYPTTVQSQAGEEVANFQGWFLPTQIVWGILFGLAVDKTTTLPLCAILVTAMIMVYALALAPSATGLQYVASVLWVISNAYIYTVKYTFCAEVFDSSHFGTLVGIIGTLAGVVNLLNNIPINYEDSYTTTCIVYIAVGFACFGILAVLWMRWRKSKKVANLLKHDMSRTSVKSFAPSAKSLAIASAKSLGADSSPSSSSESV